MTIEEAIKQVEDEIAPLTERGYSVKEAMAILQAAKARVAKADYDAEYGPTGRRAA